MPWSITDYPNSMKNLSDGIRNKAIEIANALLEEKNNMDEGILIATAISRAKDWAANRGIDTESILSRSKTTDVKKHGEDRYVIPLKNGWAVKKEAGKKVEKKYPSKNKAIKMATKKARKYKSGITIKNKRGRIKKKISYNPGKKRKKRK